MAIGNTFTKIIQKSSIPRYIRNISSIGIDYSIIAKSNSKIYDDSIDFLYGVNGNSNEEESPYYGSDYTSKRDYPELEFILDSVCDDAIIYDQYNQFASLNVNTAMLSADTVKLLEKNYRKMYSMMKLDHDANAWKIFRKWMVDGAIAYEIVYEYRKRSDVYRSLDVLHQQKQSLQHRSKSTNNSGARLILENNVTKINAKIKDIEDVLAVSESITRRSHYQHLDPEYHNDADEDLIPVRIIGFVELDPNYLTRVYVSGSSLESERVQLWAYNDPNSAGYSNKILSDNQLIYISYYNDSTTGNISYLERLVRNFNLKRKLEDSAVGWFIMNSQHRLKMVVPIGSKTTDKAKQALKTFSNNYKEDLSIDFNTGEIRVNGKSRISYSRNIVIPQRNGSTPSIDSISNNGPDLSNMKVVQYFNDNLRRDSRLPSSRYEKGRDSKVLFLRADNIGFEDMSYHSFIMRLQNTYSKLILKPVLLQTMIDLPELQVDPNVHTSIGLKYNSNFMINEAKDAEILKQRLETVKLYENVKDDDGKPVFSKKFLYVDKYKIFTQEEWDANQKLLHER